MVCREGVRGDNSEQAENALAAYGIQEQTLMDPDASLYHALGLHSVPTLVVLDAEGRYISATVS